MSSLRRHSFRDFLITTCLLPVATAAPALSLHGPVVKLAAMLSRRTDDATAATLAAQWANPSGALGVVLIIGGDIVQKALAQLVGTSKIVPVCFSFGWIALSLSHVISLAGDGQLMPSPDIDCTLFNCDSGYSRSNKSFLLGRLLRDSEGNLDREGLCVMVRKAVGDQDGNPPMAHGKGSDYVWYMSLFVMCVQVGISAIPWGLYGDWSIFLITIIGTGLALTTGSLPQWRAERYACKETTSKKNFALTRGNGSRHVLFVVGNGCCLDFESLACAESPRFKRLWEQYGIFRHAPQTAADSNKLTPPKSTAEKIVSKVDATRIAKQQKREPIMLGRLPADFWLTRIVMLALSIFWILLLLTASGLVANAWFLMLAGGIGLVQNVVIAALPRTPSQVGVHLQPLPTIKGAKVMDVLMDLEFEYPGAGKSLLGEFFPGDLREDETAWWDAAAMKQAEMKYAKDLAKSKPGEDPKLRPNWQSIYQKYGSREEWEDLAKHYDEKRQNESWRMNPRPCSNNPEGSFALMPINGANSK